jgi:hypothetical protein
MEYGSTMKGASFHRSKGPRVRCQKNMRSKTGIPSGRIQVISPEGHADDSSAIGFLG